jgi:nucleoside permease NupC
MNKTLTFFFILFLLLSPKAFSNVYNPFRNSTGHDSVSINDGPATITDSSAEESPDEVMRSKLIDEKKQIIPRSYQFHFNITSILRGLAGMAVLILIAFIFSSNRKAISWKVVGIGLAIQILVAVGILWVPAIQVFFEVVGKLFVKVIDFTRAGTEFLFKSNASGEIEPPLLNFVVTILPTIIFFSALTSVLFYFGVIQAIVYGLAWALSRALRLSGAESLAVNVAGMLLVFIAFIAMINYIFFKIGDWTSLNNVIASLLSATIIGMILT